MPEESIARIIYIFGKLTKMEAAISAAIAKSKIPAKEIKMFLKSIHPLQMERTPLFQYMKSLFREIGMGEFKVLEIAPFIIKFGVRDSDVAKLFSGINGKTCYITSDALKMFFEKDMGIPVNVKEEACVNDGSDRCVFSVYMEPLAVLQYILDENDFEILYALKNGEGVGIEDAEIRINIMEKYGLVKDGKITEFGEKYLEIGASPIVVPAEERPWKKLSEISEVIASAKSFAEAFSRSVDEDIEEIDEEKLVNVVEEAEKSKSFAELVSKIVKKEVDEDE